tara:strand:- start:2200 stop:2733 length:534 start_codon:yes stop_codon:yes gene_type:complete
MRGILTKYIEKDIETIAIPQELYKKLYTIACFYTMWCLILSTFIVYLTKKGYKLPSFIWRSAFSLTAAASICGSYVGYFHTNKLVDKFKVHYSLIITTDFITHILPLIAIITFKNFMKNNSKKKSKYILPKILLFNTIFGSTYIYLFGTNLYPLEPFTTISGTSFVTLLSSIYYSLI